MCKALTELIADGEIRGEVRGIAIGETRMNELCVHLLDKNRYEDLRRATQDSEYRKRLFAEFNL